MFTSTAGKSDLVSLANTLFTTLFCFWGLKPGPLIRAAGCVIAREVPDSCREVDRKEIVLYFESLNAMRRKPRNLYTDLLENRKEANERK